MDRENQDWTSPLAAKVTRSIAEPIRAPLLISRSLPMRRIYERLSQISGARLILIEGEAGTGKQLVSRYLHRLGPAEGNMIVEEASSLFCEDAAPNGAPHTNPLAKGVERAAGGLLLLRGLDELASPEQGRLLRFIRSFETAASASNTGPNPSPFQVICTARHSLRARVLAGKFLPELYYRLSAVCISLPPLRERKEDMPGLVQSFVDTFSHESGKLLQGLGPGALAVLLRHSWPGNVRELESVIRAACFAAEGQWLRPIDLVILPLETALAPSNDHSLPQDLTLDGVLRRHVQRVLRLCSGNKARAAVRLGISRSTLYRMLESENESSFEGSDARASVQEPSSEDDSIRNPALLASHNSL
jgi:two-component system response regulator HydG